MLTRVESTRFDYIAQANKFVANKPYINLAASMPMDTLTFGKRKGKDNSKKFHKNRLTDKVHLSKKNKGEPSKRVKAHKTDVKLPKVKVEKLSVAKIVPMPIEKKSLSAEKEDKLASLSIIGDGKKSKRSKLLSYLGKSAATVAGIAGIGAVTTLNTGCKGDDITGEIPTPVIVDTPSNLNFDNVPFEIKNSRIDTLFSDAFLMEGGLPLSPKPVAKLGSIGSDKFNKAVEQSQKQMGWTEEQKAILQPYITPGTEQFEKTKRSFPGPDDVAALNAYHWFGGLPANTVDIKNQVGWIGTDKFRYYADTHMDGKYQQEAQQIRNGRAFIGNFKDTKGTSNTDDDLSIVVSNWSGSNIENLSAADAAYLTLNEGVQLHKVGNSGAGKNAEVGGFLLQVGKYLENLNKIPASGEDFALLNRNLGLLGLANGIVGENVDYSNLDGRWVYSDRSRQASNKLQKPTLLEAIEKIVYEKNTNNSIDRMGEGEYKYLKDQGYILPDGDRWSRQNVIAIGNEIQNRLKTAKQPLAGYYYTLINGK